MEFTEDEVREKLKELGYVNIPSEKLQEFMLDLHDLIEHDASSSLTSTEQDTYDDSSLVSNYYSEDLLGDSYFERSSAQPLRERNQTSSSSRSAFSKEKVPGRSFQIADDKENTMMTDSQLSSTTESSMNQSKVRRKVARKKNGEVRVFDETLTDSEAADITLIEERMRSLPLAHPPLTRSYSSQSRRSVDSTATSQTSLPAFIRSSSAHPHTRRLQKCDPVNRYHQFRSEWQNTKLPGESKHSNLRWQVREQMLSYESYEKPKHRPMVNNYVIPTDKKRQALRWQVRTALART